MVSWINVHFVGTFPDLSWINCVNDSWLMTDQWTIRNRVEKRQNPRENSTNNVPETKRGKSLTIQQWLALHTVGHAGYLSLKYSLGVNIAVSVGTKSKVTTDPTWSYRRWPESDRARKHLSYMKHHQETAPFQSWILSPMVQSLPVPKYHFASSCLARSMPLQINWFNTKQMFT